MKFSYFKFPLPERSDYFGGSLLKPIIPVQISSGTQVLKYAVLIDSGADFCIFDAEIGEQLGLNIASGTVEEFGGIQERGGAKAYLHLVKLTIGGHTYTTTVGFSYDIAKQGYGVLGQQGFFDMFVVKFDYRGNEIEVKEKVK